jgi:hypothetical protein
LAQRTDAIQRDTGINRRLIAAIAEGRIGDRDVDVSGML